MLFVFKYFEMYFYLLDLFTGLGQKPFLFRTLQERTLVAMFVHVVDPVHFSHSEKDEEAKISFLFSDCNYAMSNFFHPYD